MDFVADTSILISFLRGHEPSVAALMSLIDRHRLCVPAVVAFELLTGVHGRRNQARHVDKLLSVAPVLPPDT